MALNAELALSNNMNERLPSRPFGVFVSTFMVQGYLIQLQHCQQKDRKGTSLHWSLVPGIGK